MGDRRRFDLFAREIIQHVPASSRIADVAGGKGHLRAALYQCGYHNVTTWDKRHNNAKGRPGTKWGYFKWDTAPADYDVVVAMHPDGATDHVIRYAAHHRRTCIVCPCCIIPSSDTFWRDHRFEYWIEHLITLGKSHGLIMHLTKLPMYGRNVVLIGKPIAEIL